MLENTLYKLKNGEPTTVVYFGGSITDGGGASDYAHSYAGLTTAMLREKFPNTEINSINAAIGGTGSVLGAYRCDSHVCSHKPDLVFFEYAVNDWSGSYDTLRNTADAIVRKLYAVNPFCDIVMIYTVQKEMTEYMAAGNVQPARTAFSSVAYHYGLMQIDVGEALLRHISSDEDWYTYTVDTCHPNDTGYKIYADTVRARLAAEFAKHEYPEYKAHSIPAPLFTGDGSFFTARMISAESAVCDGTWTLVDRDELNTKEDYHTMSLSAQWPSYIMCSTPGGSLTFEFEGTALQAYMVLGPKRGYFKFSVDGGEEMLDKSWDRWCNDGERIGGGCYVRGLPRGRHTLKITLTDEHHEEARGTQLKIAAFNVM